MNLVSARPAPLRTGVLLAAVVAAGCSPRALREETDPEVPIPASFAAADENGPEVVAPDDWWTAFGEPGLDRAVASAFEANLGLRQAWARLAQAESQATVSGSFLYPEVNIDSSIGRSKSLFALTGQSFYNNRYAVGLGLSWELDLWRKIANRAEAATLLAVAGRNDAENTALLLSGSVTDAWFSMEAQRSLLALIESQLDASRQLLELTELRYARGVGTALQVLQQRLQFESLEAEVPDVRTRYETARNSLAVLLGTPPEMFDRLGLEPDATLPELPPTPTLPSPRDLLDRRPDLRAAFARVAAADREVASAVADMLPSIRLSLTGGYQSITADTIFDDAVWSIAGNLVQPFFDAGRRDAEVGRREAILRERLDAFSERFLVALREVEDALIRERNQIELLAQVRRQIETARAALDESELLFVNGQIEYLDVITALQSLQRLQRQEVAVRQTLLANRAALHLALGGEWTRDLEPPADDDASPAHTTASPADSDSSEQDPDA